jgi:uncharacterized protein YdhG (YjbR/CyaY superfamily)
MKKVGSVDEYISSSPKDLQEKLQQLRLTIKQTVPEAEEKISYGMPYYGYKGRLAYFAYAKQHIGLYIPPPIIQNFAEELKEYSTSTATIQFPIDKKLPISLIKKLVRARVKYNQEKSKNY